MHMLRALCTCLFFICSVSAADIVLLSGYAASPTPTAAGPNRCFGSPFMINITLDVPAVAGIPDVTKITVIGQLAPILATTGSVVQGATLTEVSGANRLQWIYRATPLRDGPATLTIDPQLFGSAAVKTQALNLDTIPVLNLTSTVAGTITFTGSLNSGVDRITPEPTPLNKNLDLITIANGVLNPPRPANPSLSSTAVTILVDPLGIGPVVCTLPPGTVVDQWGNTNESTANTATVPGTNLAGPAPTITSVVGLSPANLVYTTGQSINLGVNFSRAVTLLPSVAIPPFIKLNCTGSAATPAIAVYNPVLNTTPTQIVFTYTVQSGNSNPKLEVNSANSFTLADQTAVVGTGTAPDYLADTTLPSSGSNGSLSASFIYSINVPIAKPAPQTIEGASDPDKCAVGGGIGMFLSLGSLALFGLRRRR